MGLIGQTNKKEELCVRFTLSSYADDAMQVKHYTMKHRLVFGKTKLIKRKTEHNDYLVPETWLGYIKKGLLIKWPGLQKFSFMHLQLKPVKRICKIEETYLYVMPAELEQTNDKIRFLQADCPLPATEWKQTF